MSTAIKITHKYGPGSGKAEEESDACDENPPTHRC